MIPFYVGQKVVCVNDKLLRQGDSEGFSNHENLLDGLKKDEVYTIREIGEYEHVMHGHYIGVRLSEIRRNNKRDTPYHHCRFKPVIQTDISIFQDILESITSKRLEDA